MAIRLEDLGQRVAALRGRKSQQAIAVAAGVDVSTVSRLERGKLDPSYSTLIAVARALGVGVERLLTGDGSGAGPSVAAALVEDPKPPASSEVLTRDDLEIALAVVRADLEARMIAEVRRLNTRIGKIAATIRETPTENLRQRTQA